MRRWGLRTIFLLLICFISFISCTQRWLNDDSDNNDDDSGDDDSQEVPSPPEELLRTGFSYKVILLEWKDSSSNEEGFVIERSSKEQISCKSHGLQQIQSFIMTEDFRASKNIITA